MSQRIIIGTAGHVDHGKTLLTQRLTGINTDRLPAEKARGITIELGFAPWKINENLKADIIDVPGHEKFVRTMAAGVAPIDLALLLTAADEGIMPQTKEHLDILSLLHIPQGILVISKADQASPEQIEKCRRELKRLTEGTPFQNAPVVVVSAKTGEGIDRLTAEVCRLAAQLPQPAQENQTRLPIDRCFTIKGFGTVVTGTLWSGCLTVGDTINVFPAGKTARIRRLEVNGRAVDRCQGKLRAALNLPNLSKEELPRGSWLTNGNLTAAHTVSAELYLLPAAAPLKNNARVHVRFGNKEINGRIRLTEDILPPGSRQKGKIHLETPLFPLPGDLLILASYSPVITIGSAKVLEINPKKARRQTSDNLWENAQTLLTNYHRVNPLSLGMPQGQLKKKLLQKQTAADQNQILQEWQTTKKIKIIRGKISRYDFQPRPDRRTQTTIDQLLEALTAGGFTPPPITELLQNLPPDQAKAVTEFLLEQGRICQSEGIFFAAAALNQAEDSVRSYLLKNGRITLAETRDLLGTSRKFALSILSYLDNQQITKRQGDYRILLP